MAGTGGINVPVSFTATGLSGFASQVGRMTSKFNTFEKAIAKTGMWLSTYKMINLIVSAAKNAVNTIADLDKSITNIAVVTNLSQEQLWGRMSSYMSLAQQYGVAVNKVYEVSQLFYQQGLKTADVMSMTNETLKMAKVSGMEVADAADAMTVATRAFNIEMSNAQNVTDVYSALAANFAVSTEEIANAMEKTASSAASVGMSVESTSAFMSVMIQSTRESAENIGSAMKSIISRLKMLGAYCFNCWKILKAVSLL